MWSLPSPYWEQKKSLLTTLQYELVEFVFFPESLLSSLPCWIFCVWVSMRGPQLCQDHHLLTLTPASPFWERKAWLFTPSSLRLSPQCLQITIPPSIPTTQKHLPTVSLTYMQKLLLNSATGNKDRNFSEGHCHENPLPWRMEVLLWKQAIQGWIICCWFFPFTNNNKFSTR